MWQLVLRVLVTFFRAQELVSEMEADQPGVASRTKE